jgi:hypothetical protein
MTTRFLSKRALKSEAVDALLFHCPLRLCLVVVLSYDCLALSCFVLSCWLVLWLSCLVVILSCGCLALSRDVLSCQVLSCDLSCLVLWLSCLVVVFESDSTVITQLLHKYCPKE